LGRSGAPAEGVRRELDRRVEPVRPRIFYPEALDRSEVELEARLPFCDLAP
jgi:hypothetical protein